MSALAINVNGTDVTVEAEPDTPLLWVLRDVVGMCGTKFGCGVGACGACTVLVDGEPTRSCITPVSSLSGRDVTTIEGLSPDGTHPVQLAWRAAAVSQCGYCQAGQIMTAVGLLTHTPHPSDAEIVDAFANVLCRCGTYQRIASAVRQIAGSPP